VSRYTILPVPLTATTLQFEGFWRRPVASVRRKGRAHVGCCRYRNAKRFPAVSSPAARCVRSQRPWSHLESKTTVGAAIHTEYWIPAEDLPEFNRNIVGTIVVTADLK
jgi:hypothetical protein